jgi:hypothetical protein
MIARNFARIVYLITLTFQHLLPAPLCLINLGCVLYMLLNAFLDWPQHISDLMEPPGLLHLEKGVVLLYQACHFLPLSQDHQLVNCEVLLDHSRHIVHVEPKSEVEWGNLARGGRLNSDANVLLDHQLVSE